MYNSLPAAVVLRPSGAVFSRNLAKLTSTAFYVTVKKMSLYVFIITI